MADAAAAILLAISYLTAEVDKWQPDNGCFSCHNNGDAARALYIAGRRPGDATSSWLQQPEQWEKAGANPGISDKVLASIQYAAALTGLRNPNAQHKAAQILVNSQRPDGSWKIDDLGSPATYGTALATQIAKTVLERASPKEFANAIAKANTYLASVKPTNTPDAAATNATAYLLKAQNQDGGWGPYKRTPSEVFDTAIAVIALKNHSEASTKGKDYLLRTQQPQGGWPETTRPSGGQSYAQHISTTAWALIALLQSDPKR